VSTIGLVDAKQRPSAAKPRQYSEASKCQMVAETQLLGVDSGRGATMWTATVQMAAAAVAEGGGGSSAMAGGNHRDRPRRPDQDGVIEIVFGCAWTTLLRHPQHHRANISKH
jgi:hypothetical protein